MAWRFSNWLGLLGSLAGSLLPQGCLDGHAAAACTSQWTVFWIGRNSGQSPGLGYPGRGWKVYSLGVLEGIGCEAEYCHSSKIV